MALFRSKKILQRMCLNAMQARLFVSAASSQSPNGLAYCQDFDLEICAEISLTDNIFMDVFDIINSEQEQNMISQT